MIRWIALTNTNQYFQNIIGWKIHLSHFRTFSLKRRQVRLLYGLNPLRISDEEE